jgi:hypothetical protein
MGEFGRSGSQLPHDEAAQREHLKDVDENLRRDQEADQVAKGKSSLWTRRAGYLLVLAGAAGFVASCFVPYYGGGLFGPGSETISLWQQGSPGSDSVAADLSYLLFLIGGVATITFLAIAGLTRGRPRTAPTTLVATVVAWSLTWIGLMIHTATIGLGFTLEWGYWVQALSVGVMVVGSILAVASARAGTRS